MLFAVFFESIAVAWIYGKKILKVKARTCFAKMFSYCCFTGNKRFCADIKDMIGFVPGLYWQFCWKFAAPLFLLVRKVYSIVLLFKIIFSFTNRTSKTF